MAAEPTPAQRDIRWLIVQVQQRNLPKPNSAEMEAFAERVAIKMENGTPEATARAEAFQERYGR